MMKEKILITGKGNIAIRIAHLLENKYDVYFLSRKQTEKTFVWDIDKKYIAPEALENVKHIIHLAGAGIADKRWTKKRKAEIFESRINSGRFLFEKIQEKSISLKTFISVSAIGYYGISGNKIFIEEDLSSNDFLGTVCNAWEQTAHDFQQFGIRSVILRLGIVLSKDFGALPKMIQTKNFFFAPLGSGKQPISWVHEKDVYKSFEFAIEHPIKGVYNIVSPNMQTTNTSFTKLLANFYCKPYIPIGIPEFFLKFILGKRVVLVTQGIKVSSQKIQSVGFSFQYSDLEKTIKSVLTN